MIAHLPTDWRNALLLGRMTLREGPTPVLVSGGRVRDLSRVAPTVSQLLDGWTGVPPPGNDLGPLEELRLTRAYENAGAAPRLLSPIDLQCINRQSLERNKR